jgi:hypothetical protein
MKNIIKEIIKIWKAADEFDRKRDDFLMSVREFAKALKETNDLAEKYKHILASGRPLFEDCKTIKQINHEFLTNSVGTVLKIMGSKCIIEEVKMITESDKYEINISARRIG